MTNLEFANHVKDILDDVTDKEITVKEITKNNGQKHIGIIVKDKDSNIAPTFYVDQFVDKPAYEMVDFILNFKDNRLELQDKATSIINDKEEVIKRLRLKLVNKERNKNTDKLFIDLANGLIATFIIQLDDEANIPVTQNIADNIGLIDTEIYEIARKNMEQEIDMEDMTDFLSKTQGIPKEFFPPMPPMIIVTNKNKTYGAGVILADGMKDKLTELVGDFRVIPSTVHEMLIVPNMDKEMIKEIIACVNGEVIHPEEYLSDDLFELVDDGLLRIA